MDENLTPADRAFIAADYNNAGELAKLMRNIGKQHEDEVVRLILYFKYIFYEMTEDFVPQYERNMKLLKQQLERFGNGRA